MKPVLPRLPVAVIGAGPIGLAAAAHLIDRGLVPLIFEAGYSPGWHLQSYAHVRLFSPWRYSIDTVAARMLADGGWKQPSAADLPTAGEIVDRYLLPLAGIPGIASGLRLNTRVTEITRAGFDKVKTAGREQAAFVLRANSPAGVTEHHAAAVIDASGTWGSQNPLGANGLPAIGEAELSWRIAYGMPDILGRQRTRYAGRRTLVVGSGHSALGSLLALSQLAAEAPGTRLAWAIRGTDLARIFGGGERDGLPARGELGRRLERLHASGSLELYTNFRIHKLRLTGGTIDLVSEETAEGHQTITGIDEIICATGARPDLSLARELRVKLDPWLESTEALAPLIDPNLHSCGTVRPHGHRELAQPDAGYYAVGAKSYGRAPNFLMATGYEQVRSVVAALAGDMVAADAVELDLPQTGVCSSNIKEPSDAQWDGKDCCGGPAPKEVDACCALDAEEKSAGKSGCGCGETLQPVVLKPKTACCS